MDATRKTQDFMTFDSLDDLFDSNMDLFPEMDAEPITDQMKRAVERAVERTRKQKPASLATKETTKWLANERKNPTPVISPFVQETREPSMLSQARARGGVSESFKQLQTSGPSKFSEYQKAQESTGKTDSVWAKLFGK